MRVALSSVTVDTSGFVELDVLPDTTAGSTSRRINRVATLDGGSVFNDGGYSEADRTIELRWDSTSAAADAAVARLLQLHARLQVAMPGAVYLAAPETFTPGQPSRLRLLVVAKLSA